MKKKVTHVIYGICVAAMSVLPFISVAEETPAPVAEKGSALKKEYSPFNFRKAKSEAEKEYPMARIGDEVEARTPRGTIKGKFNGLQDDKIKIGSETVYTSDLDELDKIYFDQALCRKTREDYVERRLSEYTAEKNSAVEKHKNTLTVKPAEAAAKTASPPEENKPKPDESPKNNTAPADVKLPGSNPDNATHDGKSSSDAAKSSARKNKEETVSSPDEGILTPFSPVKIILLFVWFLSGLFALKAGEKIFRKNAANNSFYNTAVEKTLPKNVDLHSFYNLFAIFLGPLALLFCYLVGEGANLAKNLFSRKSKEEKYHELPITIIDSKGNNAATLDAHEGLSFLKQLLHDALLKGASDIFIDPKKDNYAIRIRVDGTIKVVDLLEEEQALSVINMIKVAAGMDIAERRRPQDGSFSANTETHKASFRVASVGVFGGEKITLRVISSDKGKYKLNSIGLTEEQYKIVSSTIRLPSGMVLMCGPTGSGKTTSLYSMLEEIDYNMKNVISIEDPVEHVMPNISQMEVNVKAGITFASLLRNSLRQNPDIIFLGEIRDEETAQIAVNASQTGHLIIATIHSNDNIGTIDRLMNLGLPLRSIAATLHVIISQRLIRKLCTHCKVKADLKREQKDLLESCGLPTDNVSAPHSCPRCRGTGYSGRRAIFEVLIMDAGLRAVLEDPDASNTSIREYVEKNQDMANIAGEALTLVSEGVTSYEEFERVTLNM